MMQTRTLSNLTFCVHAVITLRYTKISSSLHLRIFKRNYSIIRIVLYLLFYRIVKCEWKTYSPQNYVLQIKMFPRVLWIELASPSVSMIFTDAHSACTVSAALITRLQDAHKTMHYAKQLPIHENRKDENENEKKNILINTHMNSFSTPLLQISIHDF